MNDDNFLVLACYSSTDLTNMLFTVNNPLEYAGLLLAWLGLLVLERALLHLRLLAVSTNYGLKNLVPLILKLRPQKLQLYFPWMDSTFIVINLMQWRLNYKMPITIFVCFHFLDGILHYCVKLWCFVMN